jgi:hypothetical protein
VNDERFIPLALKSYRTFQLDEEYEDLYRLLTSTCRLCPVPETGTTAFSSAAAPRLPAIQATEVDS